MGRRVGIAFASAILASVGGLGVASAADMAVKARPMPVVAFNWTGCYIGVNAGWKAGRFRDESASVPATTGTLGVLGTQTAVADRVDLDSFDTSSGAAGGQVGCRWQTASNWVFGVEGDADWTDLHGTVINRRFGTGTTFVPAISSTIAPDGKPPSEASSAAPSINCWSTGPPAWRSPK